MSQHGHADRQRRLFILGAGASYAAGLPDAGTLSLQLSAYAYGPFEVVYNRLPGKYFDPMVSVLFDVLKEDPGTGPRSRWPLDFVFNGFDRRFRADPQRFAAAWMRLFEATAQLIYIRSWTAENTPAYRKFLVALGPDDVVLTFNWDVCPEIAMHSLGKPFAQSLAGRPPEHGPWLLKLHGSVDYLVVSDAIEAAFLEPLEPCTPYPVPGSRLARLKTYDLGYEVTLEGADAGPSRAEDLASGAGVVGGFDAGPYLLPHTIDPFPGIYMLVPPTPEVMYDWQYAVVAANLARIRDELRAVYVIGYSFPDYDQRVFRLLHEIAAQDDVPVHIVNPGVGDIPPARLQTIFGEYAAHACGFEAYDWAAA